MARSGKPPQGLLKEQSQLPIDQRSRKLCLGNPIAAATCGTECLLPWPVQNKHMSPGTLSIALLISHKARFFWVSQ